MQAATAEDSLIGLLLIDKYRVIRQIGRGGMGVVYEAEHVGLGKRVAIKLMLEKYANDHEAIARFQREAFAASRIGNPHIIDVSDIGTAPDGRSFVVMELLSGAPLSRVIEGAGQMPMWRAVNIMRQVLRAVGAAHAKGIVHRDLKPDNIFLVTQDDHHDFIKLLDFGISKMIDPDLQVAATRLTTTGVVMGTPLYMAPEQAMGLEIDHQVDVYACGVILYEMLAGRPPFDGATYAVLVSKLLTQEPPNLGTVRSGLPGSLISAVHRALEKEPARRFASAEAFVAALPADKTPSMLELAGTLDSGEVLATARPVTPRKTPWIAIGAAAAVGVAAVAAFFLIQKPEGAQPVPRSTTPAPAMVAPVPAPAPAPPTTTGMLEIKSNPPGASVVIDKAAMGVTPLMVTLTAGAHHLHVELAGHTSIDEDEEVRPGERSNVVLAMPLAASTPAGHVAKPTRPPAVPPHAPPTPPPPHGGLAGPTTELPTTGSAATVARPGHDDPPPLRDAPPVRPSPPPGGGTKPNPY